MPGAASQAGDADSSRAPGLTSGLQGSLNVRRGALLLVPQWQCISSFVFYIYTCIHVYIIRMIFKVVLITRSLLKWILISLGPFCCVCATVTVHLMCWTSGIILHNIFRILKRNTYNPVQLLVARFCLGHKFVVSEAHIYWLAPGLSKKLKWKQSSLLYVVWIILKEWLSYYINMIWIKYVCLI